MPQGSPPASLKGRGSISNPPGRYEREWHISIEDPTSNQDYAPRLATTVTDEKAASIITRNASTDIPFDRSINPYRGCEHGCIYCFARPTHAYMGLSPGLDFETRIFAKRDAGTLLRRELGKPGYSPRTLMLGSNTDPYQPIERSRKITRAILKVLEEFRHPVGIVTKSVLVTRDIDILSRLANDGLVSVGISITTLDPWLARTMEPRASSPQRRLDAIRRLNTAGIPVGVLAAPMIPHLNDHELERILKAAHAAGAGNANYTLLRLPLELKDLFVEWLQTHLPERTARVLAGIRSCRAGHLNDPKQGRRMRGTGAYADLLDNRFQLACRRLGLHPGGTTERPLKTSRFRVPPEPHGQFDLFA